MSLFSLQGAATDVESKNQELSRAVEELSKLVKDTGEGTTPDSAFPTEKCKTEV